MVYLELLDIIWSVASKVVSGLNGRTSELQVTVGAAPREVDVVCGRVVVNSTVNQMNHFIWKGSLYFSHILPGVVLPTYKYLLKGYNVRIACCG